MHFERAHFGYESLAHLQSVCDKTGVINCVPEVNSQHLQSSANLASLSPRCVVSGNLAIARIADQRDDDETRMRLLRRDSDYVTVMVAYVTIEFHAILTYFFSVDPR
jgi:hypothetical protein